MREKELISVIVPVYNVEDYLERSINSILKQTYSNLQIIMVDDGSTDSSGLICDRLASEDSRIVVIHKKNGGASEARNVALDKADGDYIGFVDADDYIEPNMYECLYVEAQKYDADVVTCGYYKEEPTKTREFYSDYNEIKVFDKIDGYKGLFLYSYVSEGNWTKLVHKRIFESIRYKVGIHTEDVLLTAQLIDKSNKIVCIPKSLYHYVIRENSSSHVSYNSHILDPLYTMSEIGNAISMRYPNLLDEYISYSATWYIDMYARITENRKVYLKEFHVIKAQILSSFNEYMNNNFLDKTNKMKLFGIKYNCFRLINSFLDIWFSIKNKLKTKQ